MTSKYGCLLLLILCAGLMCELPQVSAQTGGGKYDSPRGLSEPAAAAGVGRDGAANSVADISALAGKWVWGYIPERTWTHTGSYDGGDGWRYAYRFSPDGAVEYTGIMSARTGNCSQQVFIFKKGRARLSGDTLTIKWSRGTLTRDVFCDRVNNYKETTPAETQTLKVELKNSSTGQRQFCNVSNSPESCFTRVE
jgi:hypothetical protein